MALSVSNDFGLLETHHEESPCTTSSDDLFADINWPEDEADSPSDKGQFLSHNRDNGSLKDGINNSLTFSNMSGSDNAADVSLPAANAANVSSKCSGGCRFSKEIKSILRTWFNEHKDNPYPTLEEKKELAEKTQLKQSQISLWLVNTRRRHRSRKQRGMRTNSIPQTMLPPPIVCGNPRPSQEFNVSSPMQLQRPFEEMNPMDRWKYVTPLELEPAETDIILGTVAAAPPLSFDPYNVQYRHSTSQFDSDLHSGACLSNNDYFWSRSMASYETGLTSMISGSTISDSTVFSYPAYSQSASQDRRRRRGSPTKIPKSTTKDRLFQCTFCADCTFATKHDWQRHEKSQHLSLESWTCCLSGGTEATPNGPTCAFCDTPDPSITHLETHNYSACQEKDLKERTFYRKDHFQQHLRLTHESRFRSAMNSWKAEIPMVRSRCGFCSVTFTTWTSRADHLAAHFKCHATMRDWVGDWGFEPHIAALVERVTSDSSQAHSRLAMPSMLPPPQPYKALSGATSGGMDGGYGCQQQAFTSDEIDNILAMSAGMGGSAHNTGFLGLDNNIVSDWVDFGV